jgi:enoyl-CoA hydratase/carnithine racemase
LAVTVSNAQFATSGVKYGLFCATPSVPLMRSVAQKHAMQMLLTGEFISAQQAFEHGLVNEVVEADQLDAAVERLVQSLLAKPKDALRMGKALLLQSQTMSLADAYALASQIMAANMALPCAQEGVQAFLDKRAPKFS